MRKSLRKSPLVLIVVVAIFIIVGNLFGEINLEIVDQNIVSCIQNRQYGPIMRIQVSTTGEDVLQVRCTSFSIDNTMSFFSLIRFEDLQWKEDLTGWESPVKVNSEFDLTIPAWMNCWYNETKIFTLWGTPFFKKADTQGQGQIKIRLLNENSLWISGNPEIDSDFPQSKSIVVINGIEEREEKQKFSCPFNLENYPNPFNPETTIKFNLVEKGEVELVIYNVKGQKIKELVNQRLDAGLHQVVWKGNDETGRSVSSGVYFYKIKYGSYTFSKKMILMK